MPRGFCVGGSAFVFQTHPPAFGRIPSLLHLNFWILLDMEFEEKHCPKAPFVFGTSRAKWVIMTTPRGSRSGYKITDPHGEGPSGPPDWCMDERRCNSSLTKVANTQVSEITKPFVNINHADPSPEEAPKKPRRSPEEALEFLRPWPSIWNPGLALAAVATRQHEASGGPS